MARDVAKSILPANAVISIEKYLKRKQKKKRLQKKKTLSLQVHLVDHCNLNCAGCNHFSCIAVEKYHSVSSLENDFKRINELAKGKIDLISLLGGEPLLHPELLKILDIAGKYFSKNNIRLGTNGSLLLKQNDEFWQLCNKHNISIFITKYPIKLPFKEIEQIAKKHHVALHYSRHSGVRKKMMRKAPLNLKGDGNPQECFELCERRCMVLDEGKIYTCPTIPYIKIFNKQFGSELKICDKDSIDIYKTNSLNEIFEFLHHPMPFCRYCNTKEPEINIEWTITKKEISEWV